MPKPPRTKDLPGQRFGRLTIVKRAYVNDAFAGARWLCRCDCGGETITRGGNLHSGKTRSCGCLQREVASKLGKTKPGLLHGDSASNLTPEYRAWNAMLNRCRNSKVPSYPEYGGRGIKVCDRWRESYPNFLFDMGRRPSPSHSLDRKDNNGNYEPSNCRWATRLEQDFNKRCTKMIKYRGETITALDAARISGLGIKTINRRIRRGWSAADAIETPRRPYPASLSRT